MMKTKALITISLALGIFSVFSCSQDPIFFTISTETVLQEALIKGTPTNMVVFEREYDDPDDLINPVKKVPILYVASGRLYWYAKAGLGTGASRWNLREYRIPQPGGKIIALAVTGEHLYALCQSGTGVNTYLRRIGPADDQWEPVLLADSEYPQIQSIYADPSTDRLFAGACKNDRVTYAIYFLDTADSKLKLLKRDTYLLSGTASRDNIHYLCTKDIIDLSSGSSVKGTGIFQVDETSLTSGITENDVIWLNDENGIGADTGKKTLLFMNMIKLENTPPTIIAIERKNGTLYEVLDGSFKQMRNSDNTSLTTGRYATGALSLWTDNPDPTEKKTMLIAGIQGGLINTVSVSYTHGYVEFDLNTDGSFNIDSPRRDSGKLKSVEDNDRYIATIGKHPLNHLFQAPASIDDKITFFASTQNTGLWSYRDLKSSGGLQWNAETN